MNEHEQFGFHVVHEQRFLCLLSKSVYNIANLSCTEKMCIILSTVDQEHFLKMEDRRVRFTKFIPHKNETCVWHPIQCSYRKHLAMVHDCIPFR